jgi:hypothetical protein
MLSYPHAEKGSANSPYNCAPLQRTPGLSLKKCPVPSFSKYSIRPNWFARGGVALLRSDP